MLREVGHLLMLRQDLDRSLGRDLYRSPNPVTLRDTRLTTPGQAMQAVRDRRAPHSAVSATTGSNLEALRAGNIPLAKPAPRLTSSANPTNSSGVSTGSAGT